MNKNNHHHHFSSNAFHSIDFNDFQSMIEYSLHSIDMSMVDENYKIWLLNADREVPKNMNQFDGTKNLCALCSATNDAFKGYPELLTTNLKDSYIKVIIIAANQPISPSMITV